MNTDTAVGILSGQVKHFLDTDPEVKTGTALFTVVGVNVTEEVLDNIKSQLPGWNITHTHLHVGEFLHFTRQ